jgi:DNA-binding MarR family transcriptional regulator
MTLPRETLVTTGTADNRHGTDLPDDLLSEIHVLANLVARAFSGKLDEAFDVSVPEWRVLLTLARHPGLTAAEITNRWAMDKMAISRAIQRLEAEARIRRDRNSHDRRSYSLSLTDRGHQLYETILPVAHERYHDFMSCLSKEEQTSLRQSLEKLIAQADNLRD